MRVDVELSERVAVGQDPLFAAVRSGHGELVKDRPDDNSRFWPNSEA